MLTIIQNYSPMLLEGFKNTLIASVLALFFSLMIGILMGMLQISQNRLVSALATAYVEFFRNIPLLVITMFFYVAVPMMGVPVSGFQAGVIGLTLYTSSFIADNVRAGILSIDRGQYEAGISQGMSASQVMRYIILPQAIRVVIPPLGNQFINLVKNSSTLAMVAGMDLMYYGDLIASETFMTLSTYVVVGVFYLLITVPLTWLMQYVEKRLAQAY
ncbi:glutamine ABC transporter permease [Suicoccus acidiformans]|uniref:Glutamine ABC transporter permease n=1 Tax=Suicoccus acidiformans TaxID=2036206 RepID=A0A347WJH5_9LACT|nr:amino acid ABC transporter permease [Suicoccus acidiformans]AXY25232.1 glutamine ABC transporter permease [Suicoccus acidiformans]